MALSKVSFVNDLKSLSQDLKDATQERVKLLLTNSAAGKLRLHALDGYDPTVYSIDITSGKGPRYKATFVLRPGGVAEFQRIGTHKEIDRSPK